jgi:hypothetical protein
MLSHKKNESVGTCYIRLIFGISRFRSFPLAIPLVWCFALVIQVRLHLSGSLPARCDILNKPRPIDDSSTKGSLGGNRPANYYELSNKVNDNPYPSQKPLA